MTFQCSSASRKFLNPQALEDTLVSLLFQCSSASRKFLNIVDLPHRPRRAGVSVLFSEPKIPQCWSARRASTQPATSFSALQRAENSSMGNRRRAAARDCGFSALQRAENSSIGRVEQNTDDAEFVSVLFSEPKIPQCSANSAAFVRSIKFQCSSASRKFLNSISPNRRLISGASFSALQRAENSSIQFAGSDAGTSRAVSVLFSEPKIPQSTMSDVRCAGRWRVSVLFSEPKIPQSRPSHLRPSIFPTATITLRRS